MSGKPLVVRTIGDAFSLEAQAKLAADGMKTRTRRTAALGQRYAKALDELLRAEDRMVRAQRRWDKVRARVRRLERQLAKLQLELDQESPT